MDKFPVDENNLSFSDDDGNALFITQSSIRKVNTQDALDAADYFDTLGSVSCRDSPKVETDELNGILNVEEFDWRDHKDVQYFDFSEQVDNGYEVNTQDDGYVLRSNATGSEFFVHDGEKTLPSDSTESSAVSSQMSHGISAMYDAQSVGSDLERFGNAVSDEKLDESKAKRYVKNYLKNF